MKTTKLLLLLTAISLAGCVGPLVEHVRIDQSSVKSLAERVVVLNEEQSKARQFTVLHPVTATSCKNKLWDSAPTNEDATNQLRVKAMTVGADALANLYCEVPQGTSLTTNCWSSIVCHAAAVKLSEPK
jgi:Tfp pilus assembly protein PilN